AAGQGRTQIAVRMQGDRAAADGRPVALDEIVVQPLGPGLGAELFDEQPAAVLAHHDIEPAATLEQRGHRPRRVERAAGARHGNHEAAGSIGHEKYTAAAVASRYSTPTQPLRSKARLTCDRSEGLTSDCS